MLHACFLSCDFAFVANLKIHKTFLAERGEAFIALNFRPALTRHGNPLSLVLSPKVSFRHQRQKNILS